MNYQVRIFPEIIRFSHFIFSPLLLMPFSVFYSEYLLIVLFAGIAVGLNKGHIVRRRALPPRPSRRKGALSSKTKAVRSLIKEVCG